MEMLVKTFELKPLFFSLSELRSEMDEAESKATKLLRKVSLLMEMMEVSESTVSTGSWRT